MKLSQLRRRPKDDNNRQEIDRIVDSQVISVLSIENDWKSMEN